MSQSKKLTKHSWRKRVSRLVMGGLGIYLIVVLSRNLMEVVSVQDRVGEAERKVEALELERQQLEEQLEVVGSEEFVEQQIRDQLMLAKPGETVVVVPFDSFDSTQDKFAQGKPLEEMVQDKEENLANWQKWARVFGWL